MKPRRRPAGRFALAERPLLRKSASAVKKPYPGALAHSRLAPILLALVACPPQTNTASTTTNNTHRKHNKTSTSQTTKGTRADENTKDTHNTHRANTQIQHTDDHTANFTTTTATTTTTTSNHYKTRSTTAATNNTTPHQRNAMSLTMPTGRDRKLITINV